MMRPSAAACGVALAAEQSGLQRGQARWRRNPLPRAGVGAVPAPVVLVSSFFVGSIPWAAVTAQLVAGIDLRAHGTGTVSGTGLYEVAGFLPMAAAGSLDVMCGAVGPLLAGRRRRRLGAVAAGAALCGHNWSPWLKGSGGRGVSTVLGATAMLAPEATAMLAVGLMAGRAVRQTALAWLAAIAGLAPLLRRTRPDDARLVVAALAGPVVAKRLCGNCWPPPAPRATVLAHRLLFDRDG